MQLLRIRCFSTDGRATQKTIPSVRFLPATKQRYEKIPKRECFHTLLHLACKFMPLGWIRTEKSLEKVLTMMSFIHYDLGLT